MARTIRRLLVTGAQGFVGRHFVAHVLTTDSSIEVMGIGRSPKSNAFTHAVHDGRRAVAAPLPAYLKGVTECGRYHYVPLDLHNQSHLSATMSEFRPDVVVHLASGLAGAEPRTLFRTNVEGTVSVLQALRDAASETALLVLGSTGGVYGALTDDHLPADESAPCLPVDVYGVSKLAAEQVSRILGSAWGVPVVCARIFNLLGPGQQEQHVCGRLASQCAAIHRGTLPPRLFVGDLEATRDMIDVRDVARALDLVARRATTGDVYNVATGREVRIGHILDLLLGVSNLGTSIEIRQVVEARSPVHRHFASTVRLEQLGFRPQYELADSLRDLLRYYEGDVTADS